MHPPLMKVRSDMATCAQCHAPIGELERTTWICTGISVCDDCFEAHVAGCSACRIWHEQDQAMLAQLGKDTEPLVTANDEAALQLDDRKRRAYQVFEKIGL